MQWWTTKRLAQKRMLLVLLTRVQFYGFPWTQEKRCGNSPEFYGYSLYGCSQEEKHVDFSKKAWIIEEKFAHSSPLRSGPLSLQTFLYFAHQATAFVRQSQHTRWRKLRSTPNKNIWVAKVHFIKLRLLSSEKCNDHMIVIAWNLNGRSSPTSNYLYMHIPIVQRVRKEQAPIVNILRLSCRVRGI